MSIPIALPKALAGKRVLIVEDELFVALLLEDFLVAYGGIPVGPCNSVAKALEVLCIEAVDCAVLDVNLNGEMVYPVAYALAARHLPFLFVSGYGNRAIPPGHDDWRVYAKPIKGADLMTMLATMLDNARSPPRGNFSSPR